MKDSQTNSHQNSHRSLAETLQSILDEERTQGLSIGEIVDTVEDKGFGLLFILLALPSAIPLPAVGYSTPFGICIAIIAIQMLIGRTKVGLPGRLRKIRLPLKFTQKMSHFSLLLLKKIEWFIKPRFFWIHTKAGHAALSIAVLIMAFFMMIPFPGTNTLPAISIFVIGVGIAEEDGLIAIAATLLSIIAAAFSGWLAYEIIMKVVEKAGDWIS